MTRGLAGIYAALLLLTGATVLAAFQDLGGLNLPVALGVAAGKSALVVLWFMGLRGERALVRLWAAAGAFWLLILFTLAMADFRTRDVDARPSGNGRSGKPRPAFQGRRRWCRRGAPATTQVVIEEGGEG